MEKSSSPLLVEVKLSPTKGISFRTGFKFELVNTRSLGSFTKGRYYVATRDVEPGEVVLETKPWVQVTTRHRIHPQPPLELLHHCQGCCASLKCGSDQSSEAMVWCQGCKEYCYCSERCMMKDWNLVHGNHECAIWQR